MNEQVLNANFDQFKKMIGLFTTRQTAQDNGENMPVAFDFRAIKEGNGGQNIRLNNANDETELQSVFNRLKALNSQGFSVYHTVNISDGKGVRSEHITHIRGFFLDFDKANHDRVKNIQTFCDEHNIPQPNLINESSNGKHHFYWLFPVVPVNEVDFSDYQKRLIHYFSEEFPNDKPDDKVHDLPRVMRTAGFIHQKKDKTTGELTEPFLSHIVHIGDLLDFNTVHKFVEALPPVKNAKPTGDKKHKAPMASDDDGDQLEWAVRNAPKQIGTTQILHLLKFCDNQDYDEWLKVGMALHAEFTGDEDGFLTWLDWSETAPNFVSEDDLRNRWCGFGERANPVTARSLYHFAKANPAYKPYEMKADEKRSLINHWAEINQADLLEYELNKKLIAKQIGVDVRTLDKLIKDAQKNIADPTQKVIVEDTEPYAESVDGEALADEILALIKSVIACKDETAIIATLWIFFTWIFDISHNAPIAWINAPEKRCGKSTLAMLMLEMVKRGFSTIGVTPAPLFRVIELYKPTLVIDEADTFLNANNGELQGIINAGFTRKNGYILRCVGDNHEIKQFSVYAPKIISGIGKLPETLIDRALPLTLQRKLSSETKVRLKDIPAEKYTLIRQKLARWADDHMEDVRTATPELPQELNNRELDKWEILMQIADVLGDQWRGNILRACASTLENEKIDLSLNEQLLSDIKAIFDKTQSDRLKSKDLLNYLIGGSNVFDDLEKQSNGLSVDCEIDDDETPRWATFNYGKPMTAHQLTKHLKEFKIEKRNLRIDGKQHWCYDKVDFNEAFKRYLSPTNTEQNT